MSTPPSPAPSEQRLESIDALRGFALAGVLLANLDPFSLYLFLDEAARDRLPTAGVDHWVGYATRLLVYGKAITVFSLLFGLGTCLQLQRARERGAGPGAYLRRIGFLLALGGVHTYLLWWGDILLIYALLALVLLACRNAPDPLLLVGGLALALGWPLFKPLLLQLEPAGLAPVARMHADTLAAFASDSVATTLLQNLRYANWNRWDSWGVWPFVLANFLLGMWAGRTRVLQDPDAHRGLLRAVVVGGGLLGLAASVLEPRLDLPRVLGDHGVGGITAALAQAVLQRLGPLGMGGAYAAGFVLLYRRPGWHRRLRVLAPLGRMALTCYLMQTVVCLAIFYGIGLGLGPRGGFAARYAVWLLVLAAQLGFCHWWLARYRFGPVEWLWRWATYGHAPPLRGAPAATPRAAARPER